MLCPVCKTECGTETVCKECGFDQIQVEFLNREEATLWMETVVVPYREKWQSNQTEIVDLKNILFKQKEIEYFFDVTIPAAESKNEALGHILLICPYERLRNFFVEHLKSQLPYRDVKEETATSKLSMSNFAAALSSLQPGDVYCINPKLLPTGKQYTDDIAVALKDFALIVRIGKGPGAREIRLDLPPFTFMAFANKISEVPKAYLPLFENIIEIKVDKCELCKMEIQIVASELEMKILPTAIELIAEEAKNDVALSVSYIKRISDYMIVKGMAEKTVTAELAKEIISRVI